MHSEIDGDMPFVREADEAVLSVRHRPGRISQCRQHYRAAIRTGARTIHRAAPLSENAGFAERVAAAGLIWIGAPAAAIRAAGPQGCGEKKRMIAAGVLSPGYLGEDRADNRLRREADAIDHPVLIKAVAGGGGRGMRRVDGAVEFAAAYSPVAGAKRGFLRR